jgi:hypothetical protein
MNVSGSNRALTAIERARLAYALMVQRHREVIMQRRSRERTRVITVVVLCVGLIALILGAAIYNNWMPTSLRSATLSRKADDGKFGETRNGQVRSFIRGNTCQELQFSNDSGVYVGGSLVPCEVEAKRETATPSKGTRVNSIRDAFSSR